MRILPSCEVIGQMPDQMFVDIQNAIPFEEPAFRSGYEDLRWPPKNPNAKQRDLLDAVEPCLYAVLETESRLIRFIQFSIENGLILPGESQRSNNREEKDRWHPDRRFPDRNNTFVTANCHTTEVLGRKRPNPGDLISLGGKRHRSPTNHTNETIHRVWLRARVSH